MEVPVSEHQAFTVQPKLRLDCIDATQTPLALSRPGTAKVPHAANSTHSSLVAEDIWPSDHLFYDHGHHLTADSLLDCHTGPIPFLFSSSGLTCSRYDEALPLLPSQLSFGALSQPGSANWEQAMVELADQATATSPLSKLLPGSLVTQLDMPDHAAATPQMTALHHLQQVQQGFTMPAGQLHQDLHQLPLSHLPTTPLQHAAELQLQRLTKDMEDQSWSQSHMPTLQHFQDISKLQWQSLVPQDPSPQLYPQPLCFSDAALQQAMQLSAVHADERPCTSKQHSDEFGGASTSSTGYSRSPPRSPRIKRPSSRNAGQEYTSAFFHSRFTDAIKHEEQQHELVGQAQASRFLFDSPESVDTPDHGRDSCARNMFAKEELRERAATTVYGLRRLRACPRWAKDSADLSGGSASEDEVVDEDSCSDTEELTWSRRPSRAGNVTGQRNATRRRRRPRFPTGDTTCSSQFRGVSKHRLTQRWEASLWLEGRQLYLGGFQTERDAARAYDIAALSCKGPSVLTNYAQDCYTEQLQDTAGCSTDEMIAYVRRKSAAFSRGRSKYRGVSGQAGRWEARIGAYCGRKNVSFGVHEDEESAARQYDRALLIEKGRAAKTNFPLPDYEKEAKEFETFVLERCDSLTSEAAKSMLAKWVLPLASNTPEGGPQPVVPKKKGRGGRPRSHAACTILAEDLRQAITKR